jgi:hypothetical protein
MVLAQKDSDAPRPLGWREECAWLASIAWDRLAIGGVLDAVQYARLRRILDAIDQPEQSRPGVLPDLALAQATIKAMKEGEPIEADGIRAVVEAAEAGIEDVRSFDLRWKADMRAIERWQTEKRLLTGNDHSLIWPDHADLVVWLLGQLEREAPFPPIAEVSDLLARLARAILVSGGNSLAIDSRKMIDRMAQALQHSERQRFSAETMRRQLTRHLDGVAELLGELYAVFRGYEAHHRDRAHSILTDDYPTGDFRQIATDGAFDAAGESLAKAERNANLAGQISATLELIGRQLSAIGIRDDGRVLRAADMPKGGPS